MLFKKRIQRSLDTMHERNRRFLEEHGEYTGPDMIPSEIEKSDVGRLGLRDYGPNGDEKKIALERAQELQEADELERQKERMAEYRKQNESLDFEKGDVLAIIIAAFATFGPVLLFLIGILSLFAWFMVR